MHLPAQLIVPLILIGLLIGITTIVGKIVLPKRAKGQLAYPYRRRSALFTPAERSFLPMLEQALQGQLRVFGKVRLEDVIEVKSGVSGGARQGTRNRIKSRHLDFVVCDPKDLSIQFAVELDDSSHQEPRQREKDEFLDNALKAAGLQLFRFPARRAYSVQDIRGEIFGQSSDISAHQA